MNTDQRNDLADKPRHQLFFAPPCSLRRCAMPRGLLCLRFGGADGLLCGEPPAVDPAIQVLFQFPQCGLVRLLRSAGAIVVEPDRQLLKGHANLVRLADAEVASHQIQLSGRQHLLHPLHQQRPAHEAIIGNGGIAAAADGEHSIPQLPRAAQRLVFLQQCLGRLGGYLQLFAYRLGQFRFRCILRLGAKVHHSAELAAAAGWNGQRKGVSRGIVGQRRFYRGCRIGQQLCSVDGVKAPRRVQQCQRCLLLQVLRLTPRRVHPRQVGEVTLVL